MSDSCPAFSSMSARFIAWHCTLCPPDHAARWHSFEQYTTSSHLGQRRTTVAETFLAQRSHGSGSGAGGFFLDFLPMVRSGRGGDRKSVV